VKVAVCVKTVPEEPIWLRGDHRLDPETLRLVRSERALVSPHDRHALEEALRVRDESGGGEVVAVTMAPVQAVAALRSALALGVDRAVVVCDDALAGSDLLVTGRVLARVLEREAPELVLFGPQGEDSNGAVLFASVAERLRSPLLSQASKLEVAGGRARIERQTEHGFEAIEAPLPCVVAVTTSINQPRYASPRGLIAAKTKSTEVVALAELGIAPESAGHAGSGTDVSAISDPPPRPEPHLIENADGAAAGKVLAYLAERGLVQ
jgi:electron transfer flavoprotein beta subunit